MTVWNKLTVEQQRELMNAHSAGQKIMAQRCGWPATKWHTMGPHWKFEGDVRYYIVPEPRYVLPRQPYCDAFLVLSSKPRKGRRAIGRVYNDRKGRFLDRSGIVTSVVKKVVGDVIYTQNSTYRYVVE
jgi:hypothetical protein